MVFRDKADNRYYVEDDKLYVTLKHLNRTRYIGNLSMSIKDNKYNLVIFREPTQKVPTGYMVSKEPFDHMKINRIVMIVSNTKAYLLDLNKEILDQCWVFRPEGGWENQMIIPDHLWSEMKELSYCI